jgi:hypothetical protein
MKEGVCNELNICEPIELGTDIHREKQNISCPVHFFPCKSCDGRAMAQAVSRRPLTAEARVRSRISPCEICGEQSGTGTGFSPSCRFSPVNFIPPVLHYLERSKNFIFIIGLHNKP